MPKWTTGRISHYTYKIHIVLYFSTSFLTLTAKKKNEVNNVWTTFTHDSIETDNWNCHWLLCSKLAGVFTVVFSKMHANFVQKLFWRTVAVHMKNVCFFLALKKEGKRKTWIKKGKCNHWIEAIFSLKCHPSKCRRLQSKMLWNCPHKDIVPYLHQHHPSWLHWDSSSFPLLRPYQRIRRCIARKLPWDNCQSRDLVVQSHCKYCSSWFESTHFGILVLGPFCSWER